MNEKERKYYKIIGKMKTGAGMENTPEEALSVCIKLLIDGGIADHAAVWYRHGDVIKPIYWLCPAELISAFYKPEEGIVGRVFSSAETEIINDFASSPDEKTAEIFSGTDISACICLPVFAGESLLGCVQLIKCGGGFSRDDMNVFEILSLLLQIRFDEYVMKLPDKTHGKILLSARNIKKSFGKGENSTEVLRGINLDVAEGEFICILGESGCGKSTLLNILGGILGADDGSLTFDGSDITHMSRKELTRYRRENIGFVFQAYNLMPNLNAEENVRFIAELSDNPRDAGELLSMLGICEKTENYPYQLSGGQLQRVSIARALAKSPHIVLADEPTAALDYETGIGVLSAFENVIKNKTTLIMVTHNTEIAKMADRVIRLRGGKIYESFVNIAPKKASELVW